MDGSRFLKNSQIIILGLSVAAGSILSSLIIAKSLIQIKKISSEVISVTGSADRKIISDYMAWKLSFSKRDPLLAEGFRGLKDDLKLVREYLLAKGIHPEELIISPVQTEVFYRKNERGNDTNEIEGYRLSQDVEVRSSDVERVTKISREATELIDQGIELASRAPEYFYTKLPELKVEMLREASKDAKKRAEEIATSSGNEVGVIRSARMGVFQITPVNSYEISDWGTNDTSSLEKKVTAVVKADFSIRA